VLPVKPICPICRSRDVVVLQLSEDMRTAHIECAACGQKSYVPYPPRTDDTAHAAAPKP
jgi:transcription elongation factor Elf1